jgi:hypothetical protein
MMRIWFALLVAPGLALADQTVSYAAVSWACGHGHAAVLHIVHGVFLVAVAVGTFMASRLWAGTRSTSESSEALARQHFLAGLAAASGALSTLVIASMWMPTWIIAPCSN